MSYARSIRNKYYNVRHHLGRLVDWGNLPYAHIPNKVLQSKLEQFRYLKNRPVAFVISTGRSGSGYVCEVFSKHPQVYAFHEPRPRLNGWVIDADIESEHWRKAQNMKTYAICRQLERMPADSLYLETSHMFIKTFWHGVTDFFENIKVVQLVRDEACVLKSCLELGYFSKKNLAWKNWMKVPDFASEDEPSMQCIAYLRSIEKRAYEFFESNENNSRVVQGRFSLEELCTDDGLKRIASFLCVDDIRGIREASPRVVNSRSTRKRDIDASISIDYCQQLIDRYEYRYPSP